MLACLYAFSLVFSLCSHQINALAHQENSDIGLEGTYRHIITSVVSSGFLSSCKKKDQHREFLNIEFCMLLSIDCS